MAAFFMTALKRYIPIIVSAAFLALLAVSFDAGEIFETLRGFSIVTVMSLVVLLGANVALVSFRLWRLLAHFGTKVDYLTSLRANIAGLVSGLVMIALAGAIIGRRLVLRRAGVGLSAVGLISTYERVVVAAVGATLCAVGGVILFGGRAVEGVFVQLPIWQISLALALSIALAALVSTSRYEWELVRGLVGRRGLARVSEIAGVTALGQALSLCGYAVALYAIGVDAGLATVLGAAAIVSFAASIPISVNGWGVREVAAVYAFGHIGVDSPEAVAVSVLFGICSTLVVLMAAPVLRGSVAKNRSSEAPDGAMPTTTRSSSGTMDTLQRPAAMILGYVTTVLVFFQVKASLQGGEITVNMADPFALVALTLLGVGWIGAGRPPIRLPRLAWIWLASVALVVLVGFAIGVTRFGVTAWALNNRLIGGAILLGYFAIGALLVASWGRHGARRFMEIVATTAVAIVLTILFIEFLQRHFDTFFLFDSNFQGFSSNRNTFAFQIVVAVCCAIVVGGLRKDPRARALWAGLLIVLLFGLWQTESKTGMAVGAVVLGFALVTGLGDRRTLRWLCGVGVVLAGAWLIIRGYDPSSAGFSVDNMLGYVRGLNVESLQKRWFSVAAAIDLWWDYPIFGAGLGAFMNQVLDEGVGPLVIHATPAWILTEFGLVGTTLVYGLPCIGLYKLIQRRGWQRLNHAFLLLLGLAFLLFGLMHDLSYQRLFWLALGATLAGAIAMPSRRAAVVDYSDTPRVLHVITTLDRGGAETMLIELLRESRGKAMVAVLASGGQLVPAVERLGVPYIELGFSRNMPSAIGLFRLARYIRRHKPDIVQGWMYHGDFIAFLALMLSGRRSRTGLFWGVRCSDMDLSRYGYALRLIVRTCALLSRFTDGVIANSDVGRDVHLKLGYRPPVFDVVPNGFDTERFSPDAKDRRSVREELGIATDARVLVHVARVDPMKNHLGLLSALDRVPGAILVLIGRGTLDLPTHPRAIPLGLRDDVGRLLRAGDGVVLSSLFGEGFPNALAEGMAAGLVPITTDVGDAAIIAKDFGWVVPKDDSASLIAAMSDFMELSREDLVARQAAARRSIVARFSVRGAAQGFNSTYTKAPERADHLAFESI